MAQNKVKHAWHSDLGRRESFNVEHVDAFVLHPSSSHALVQHLYTNPAWKITCEASSLVIFVRSRTECIDGCTEKEPARSREGHMQESGRNPHPHTYRSCSRG